MVPGDTAPIEAVKVTVCDDDGLLDEVNVSVVSAGLIDMGMFPS
jgi:hypothetical protein